MGSLNVVLTGIAVGGLAGAFASCGGVKFQPEPVNAELPASYLNRTQLKNFSVYQANLGSLAGHILSVRKDEHGNCPTPFPKDYSAVDLSIRTYVKPEAKPQATAQATPIYESKITKGGEGSITLPVVSGNVSDSSAIEVTISDVVLALDDAQIDTDALEKIANKPEPADVCRRFFVRGAALSTILYKKYASISAGGTSSGAAFGTVGGKVYGNSSKFAQDYTLGMELQRLVPSEPVEGLGGPDLPRVLESLTVPQGGFKERAED